MKKLVLSTFSAFLLLFVLAGAVFAAPKPAAEREEFKGSLQAFEVGNPVDFPIIHVVATGSGKASQLGKFTYSYTVDILLIDPANGVGVGTLYYTFVAANGDKLYSVGDGYGSPAPGLVNTNRVVEQHIITGGTGRFAGATGKFTVDRLISNGSTSGTINGYIVLVDR
jgi:hypothetical protein